MHQNLFPDGRLVPATWQTNSWPSIGFAASIGVAGDSPGPMPWVYSLVRAAGTYLYGVTFSSIEADAVLFDSDGVLVDSHAEVERAWRQLATEFDLDAEALLLELIGVRAVDTLSRYLPEPECLKAMARLEDLEVDLAAETKPIPGALELVEQLGGRLWTIVTSATLRLAKARWSGAGIPLPSRMVTAGDVSDGKPNPEPFLVGARILGVAPTRCVVFEDSPSGGLAGFAAGATVIAVGDLAWSREPAARVSDLVGVTVDEGDPLTLVLPSQND